MLDAAHSRAPELTVVLVTAGKAEALHRTLASIAAQTMADRIEVLIAAPSDDYSKDHASLLERFQSFTVFEEGEIENVDHVVGRTLLKARAPIVAAIEDHAYPDPEWAEQLLSEYDEDCVAVGSAMINANPQSPLSWSNMLIAYGQWTETTPDGPIPWIALHNGSYRREALTPFGETLWTKFNRESEILEDLRDGGGAFRFASKARIRHLNPSNLKSTARLRFDAGRLYAANRADDEGWSWPKRLTYSVLGPVIPFLRYVRMRRELFGGHSKMPERTLGLALFVGLVFDGAGQIAGFLSGPGGARARLAVFEMDRLQHLNPRDSAEFTRS